MSAIVCALFTVIGFYFSIGLGEQWWLAWLAPIPVLWFAFGETKGWQAFVVAFVGFAVGSTSVLRTYGGVMPPFVLVLIVCGPALLFAASVLGARRVSRAFGIIAGMFAFALLWTGLDFLSSFNRAGGSVSTAAVSQVAVPMLMQTASLVSYIGVTFLLGAVSAGIAATLRTRDPRPAIIAVALFAANATFGYVRMSTPPNSAIHTALIESNDTTGARRGGDKPVTMKAIDAYVTQIEKLRGQNAKLIVMPENMAQLGPGWRGDAEAKLARAANDVGATLVAGFNTYLDGAQRNVSIGFTQSAPPMTYLKRRLVQGLETQYYTPGPGPAKLANGVGLEICKDMDFQAMVRRDEVATKPILLAVPAWDFGSDDWSHARVAITRSIENGVPMARNGREGLLTLNDRYGRIVARSRTTGAFQTLIGDLPLDGTGGNTIYDQIGDVFGWLCAVLGFALVGASLIRQRA
jgi:apolipoprotein N-acyltransferase